MKVKKEFFFKFSLKTVKPEHKFQLNLKKILIEIVSMCFWTLITKIDWQQESNKSTKAPSKDLIPTYVADVRLVTYHTKHKETKTRRRKIDVKRKLLKELQIDTV